MLGEALGLYPQQSIASFYLKTNPAHMFFSCGNRLLLRSRKAAFVRERSERLVYIQDNCAQVPENAQQKEGQDDDNDNRGYGWLCPVCDLPMTYVGVEDGHGDYGTSLCDIYRCKNCGIELEGHCIDGGLSN